MKMKEIVVGRGGCGGLWWLWWLWWLCDCGGCGVIWFLISYSLFQGVIFVLVCCCASWALAEEEHELCPGNQVTIAVAIAIDSHVLFLLFHSLLC